MEEPLARAEIIKAFDSKLHFGEISSRVVERV